MIRTSLCAALLLGTIPFAAMAAETGGAWIDSNLQSQSDQIWADMSAKDIAAVIEDMPDRIGSRALSHLQKAVLLAPVTAEAKPEKSKKSAKDKKTETEGVVTDADLLTLRLKKLMAMGGIDEAKRLADQIDDDSGLEPKVMDQALLALIADDEQEAACLDLLAYKSESAETFAQLSDPVKGMVDSCTGKTVSAKRTYTLTDLARMGDIEAAQIAYDPKATLLGSADSVAEFNAFRDLPPFKQSLVMHSPFASVNLQWHMLPYALRHDLIAAEQAGHLLLGAPMSGKNIAAEAALDKAKGKVAWGRLPFYYKALKSWKKDDGPPPTEALATDILASGASYDMYALIPFAPWINDLDLGKLKPRGGYAAGLVLGLAGYSPTGDAGKLDPNESPWILSVLTRDQAYNEMAFSTWADAFLDKLSGMDLDLKAKLFLLLGDVVGDKGKTAAYMSHYDNKKDLTKNSNYVMHDVLAMSRAERSAQDGTTGPMVVALAQANGNYSPDRLDPAGMIRMIRLLNDTGLTQSAKELAMETLVFRMGASAANGE